MIFQNMNLADWAIVCQTIIGAIMLVSLWFFGKQTKITTASLNAHNYEEIASAMMKIDLLFVEHPKLRKYFYENAPLDNSLDEEKMSKVMAISEMIVDLMDLTFTIKQMSINSGAAKEIIFPLQEWEKYFVDLYNSSPALRFFLKKHDSWFNQDLLKQLRMKENQNNLI